MVRIGELGGLTYSPIESLSMSRTVCVEPYGTVCVWIVWSSYYEQYDSHWNYCSEPFKRSFVTGYCINHFWVWLPLCDWDFREAAILFAWQTELCRGTISLTFCVSRSRHCWSVQSDQTRSRLLVDSNQLLIGPSGTTADCSRSD